MKNKTISVLHKIILHCTWGHIANIDSVSLLGNSTQLFHSSHCGMSTFNLINGIRMTCVIAASKWSVSLSVRKIFLQTAALDAPNVYRWSLQIYRRIWSTYRRSEFSLKEFSSPVFLPNGFSAVWNFRRTEFSPNRIFAEGSFRRTKYSPNGIFA